MDMNSGNAVKVGRFYAETVSPHSKFAGLVRLVHDLLPQLEKAVDGTFGSPGKEQPTEEQVKGFGEAMQYIKGQLEEMKSTIQTFSGKRLK